jgi:YHS domain-containing protein
VRPVDPGAVRGRIVRTMPLGGIVVRRGQEVAVIDPVCGMEVTQDTAAGAWEHAGELYFFCSPGCMARFRDDAEAILARAPEDRHM